MNADEFHLSMAIIETSRQRSRASHLERALCDVISLASSALANGEEKQYLLDIKRIAEEAFFL